MTQVLITRTEAQAQPLVEVCEFLNLKPIIIPCVDIRPDLKNNSFKRAIKLFTETDIVITVSANAAKLALPHCPKSEKQPLFLAIGPATAAAVQEQSFKVDAIAEPPDSNGLLDVPCLQAEHIKDKKVAIFCGRNPKPLLAETLAARGAKVHLAFCYERICPVPLTAQAWQEKVNMDKPFITISTSSNLLENLVFITPNQYLPALSDAPLLVISDAMKEKAINLGFGNILQAANATISSIRRTLEKLAI